MKTSFSFYSVAVVLASLGSVFGTQGCGKNMNLALKNKPVAKNQPLNDGDIRKTTRAGYPNLEGALEPFSVFDVQDKSIQPANPSLAGNHPFTQIGRADDGYVTDSNVLFRAIHRLPNAKDVLYIKDLKLVLKGVTRFSPKGESKGLEGQVLCLLANAGQGQHHCLGVKPEKANPEFWKGDAKNSELKADALSQIPLEEELADLSDASGKVFGPKSNQDIVVDLLAAFKVSCDPALEKTDLKALEACGQKQVAWLESVSSVFSVKTGHRKFRFSLAPQTYVNEGHLLMFVGFKDPNAKIPEAATLTVQDYTQGPSDGEIAVLNQVAQVHMDPTSPEDRSAVTPPQEISTKAPELKVPANLSPAAPAAASEANGDVSPATVDGIQTGRHQNVRLDSAVPQQISEEAIQNHLNRVRGSLPKIEAAPASETPAAETPALEKIEPQTERANPAAAVQAPIVLPAPVVVIVQNPAQDAQKADIKLDLYDLVLKFKVNEAAIAKKDLVKLKATAQLLNDSEKYLDRLFLIGHTSVTGSKEFNQVLSDKRANAVKYQLIKKFGLRATVAASGVGSPKVSSCAPVRECDRDRRVELKIRLSESLKTASADPVELERIRNNIADALRQIWESGTEVQK